MNPNLAPIMLNRFKSLRTRYSRIAGWHAAVDAHRNEGAPYPSVRRMPGKAVKAYAYDDARCLARYLDITVPAEMVGTLHELRYVLASAGVELGVDTSRIRQVPASIPTRAVAR